MNCINIITQKMIFGGKCLAKNNGKNVFIPFSLPDESLNIQIVQSKRDYEEGKIQEIVKPSPHRVEPACPLYGRCGGCNMMHIDSAYQIELKKQILQDIFDRAGIKIPAVETVSGSPLGYRNRFQLHDGGLEERGTNHIIPINKCLVANEAINSFFASTPMEERPKGRTQIFASQKAEPEISIAPDGEAESGQKEIVSRKKMSSKQKKKAGKHFIKPRFEGISSDRQCPIQIELCGKKIFFDAQGFFQSNIEVLEKTIPHITEGLSGRLVLDMYSGAGTFSVFLAQAFDKVIMVEHNRGAMVFAEQNMTGADHESYGISGADFVKNNVRGITDRLGDFDAVVVDPPRSGMEREVLDWLCRSKIPAVRYLSCNPSTQARDIERLTQSGYEIDKIWLLDFYPQTSHIETLLSCILK